MWSQRGQTGLSSSTYVQCFLNKEFGENYSLSVDGKEMVKYQVEARKAGSRSASILITTENLLCASTNSKGFDYVVMFFFLPANPCPIVPMGKMRARG